VFDIEVAAMYCAALRRDVLERVGFLDEAFGVGMFEDDDFSMRVREAGYRVVCAEDAYVHHVGQGAFSKLTGDEYNRIWNTNRAIYETKWKKSWTPHRVRNGVAEVRSKIE
jgi:GT2 family glycosyltransferase